MQTFLPVADFADSARLLDSPRLGKQRVEALQILRAIELPDYGWVNHPAVLMWGGGAPPRGGDRVAGADARAGGVRAGDGADLAGARVRRQHREPDRRVRPRGRGPAAGGAGRRRTAADVAGRRRAAPLAPLEPDRQGPRLLPLALRGAVRCRAGRPALRL